MFSGLGLTWFGSNVVGCSMVGRSVVGRSVGDPVNRRIHVDIIVSNVVIVQMWALLGERVVLQKVWLTRDPSMTEYTPSW